LLNSLTKYHLINSTECKIYDTKKIKLTLYYVIIRIANFKQYLVHIIIRHVVLLTVMENAINKNKKYIHTYIHTHTHTYKTYIHTHTHTCIHTYIHTYVRTYSYVHTYIQNIHTYLHTHTYIHIYTHIHRTIICTIWIECGIRHEMCQTATCNQVKSTSYKLHKISKNMTNYKQKITNT